MTRMGNLLDFRQLFKACGNNYFRKITHILGIFCKGVKIFVVSRGIIFGQLLETFGDFFLVTLLTWHHQIVHLRGTAPHPVTLPTESPFSSKAAPPTLLN